MNSNLPVFKYKNLVIPNAVALGSMDDWSKEQFDFHKKTVKASGIDYRNYIIRRTGKFGPTCGYATGMQNAQILLQAICEIEPEDYFRIIRMMGYQRYNIAAVKRMPHVIKTTQTPNGYHGYCVVCDASRSVYNGVVEKLSIAPFTTDCLGFRTGDIPYGLIPEFLDYKNGMWIRNKKKMKWDDFSYPSGSSSEKKQRAKILKLKNSTKKP